MTRSKIADIYYVTNVLPGNPVTREYDATQHVASCGPELLWKIYSGTKKSTGQEVSVWVLERKSLERYSQTHRDTLIATLKQGVAQATRLRHPRLLTIEHPLEESRDCLAFATEPVFCSLANALGRTDNMPSIVPADLSDMTLDDLEIRHGFLQLAEALSFIHNDAKILHCNICPESIVINKRGGWKLTGFEFSRAADPTTSSFPPIEFNPHTPPVLQPVLDYIAPEHIVESRAVAASDMFSIGVLAYSIFNRGKTFMDNGGNLNKYRKNVNELKTLPVNMLHAVPNEFRDYVKMCLNYTPDLRPDANQFTKIAYFNTASVKTLICLESLCQLDNSQRMQFFKGLPSLVSTLPKRAQLQKVLPCLTAEFKTPEMIPFILPNVLAIAEGCTKQQFSAHIFTALIPLFTMTHPVQIMLILLQRIELLLKLTGEEDVRKYVLPLIYGALDSGTPQVQELCLGIIPSISHLVDQQNLKNRMLPTLLKLSAEASVVSVKVNSLLCIAKQMPSFEKWMVTDQILPALPKIASKEPGVLMAILGIYKMAFESDRIKIGKDQLAKSVLPHLCASSVEKSLNIRQFDSFMTLIKLILANVEKQQRAHLEQLSALQEGDRAGIDVSSVLQAGLSAAKGEKEADIFRQLGVDKTAVVVDTSSSGAVKKTTAGLSLEDKQRIAREQEQTLRMRSQGKLQPKHAENKTPTREAKNLTATLGALPPPPMGGLTAMKPMAASAAPNYNISMAPAPMAPSMTPAMTPSMTPAMAPSMTPAMAPSMTPATFSMTPQAVSNPCFGPMTSAPAPMMMGGMAPAGMMGGMPPAGMGMPPAGWSSIPPTRPSAPATKSKAFDDLVAFPSGGSRPLQPSSSSGRLSNMAAAPQKPRNPVNDLNDLLG